MIWHRNINNLNGLKSHDTGYHRREGYRLQSLIHYAYVLSVNLQDKIFVFKSVTTATVLSITVPRGCRLFNRSTVPARIKCYKLFFSKRNHG